MKALKFLSVFLFSLAMVGCFHVSAYAAEVETDSDYIFLSPEEISMEDVEQSTLIRSQTYTVILDENGDPVDVIEGDLPALCDNSFSWENKDGGHFTATIQLSWSGITNRYYVGLRANANTDYWFTASEFHIRPTGASGWTSRENKYNDEPTSIYEMIGFIYYGNESDLSVDVKGYFHVRGPYGYHAWAWPNTTLDDPY